MDAIQFGRWLSNRRRRCGWSSQRALAEATQQEPFFSECDISEKFLARLEAGHLVHPFRGAVRQRVLALAALVCTTPREVQTYLRAAELTALGAEEAAYVQRLHASLQAQRADPVMLLPPRPTRLVGRVELVDDLLCHLATGNSGLYAVTGMPGVGKSALAFEVMHRLVADERQRRRLFPHGVAIFTCTGRRDTQGMVALLHEIAEAFPAAMKLASRAAHSGIALTSSNESHAWPGAREAALADALARARLALAGKRTLLLLDDVDAQFPLRLLRDALLIGGAESAIEKKESQHGTGRMGDAACKVLITSRYVPAPALLAHHLSVEALEPEPALDLFTALRGRPLSEEQRADAERICAAVGYLPLAIEAAASAVTTEGIPLSLLAACLVENPLGWTWDGEREVSSRLAQALDALDPELQQHFVLLSTLGRRSFGLEGVAALYLSPAERAGKAASHGTDHGDAVPEQRGNAAVSGEDHSLVNLPLSHLAHTADDLGHLVRHSVVELLTDEAPAGSDTLPRRLSEATARYRLHPLLYAHALERLEQLEPETVRGARRNVHAYALAYLERHQGEVIHLERERGFLLAALAGLWQQQQYSLVVRCVEGLLPLASHLGSSQDRERVLLWGIHASQHVRDQYHLAYFLSDLGLLRVCRGEPFAAVRRVLAESLALVEALQRLADPCLWRPFITLAYMASLEGEDDAVRRFTGTMLQRTQKADEPFCSSYGFLMHGAYARLLGERDRAYQDLSACLHLLTRSQPAHVAHREQVLVMAQMELARVQGDYAGSYKHMEHLIALAKETCQDWEVADILLDQAEFASQQGVLADAQRLAQRALAVSDQEEMPHFQARATKLLHQLAR
jgi:AAA ATPase domain